MPPAKEDAEVRSEAVVRVKSDSNASEVDGLGFRRQLSLRMLREKLPAKEFAVAESRRLWNEGATAIGRKLNMARTAFGSISQSFKRTTRRRKQLVESPSTPGNSRRSSVSLYSPFGIESPMGRPTRSNYITPRRRYHDNVVNSERRAGLRSAAAYKNEGLDSSDAKTPSRKRGAITPNDGGSSAKRKNVRQLAATPGLTRDIEHINDGMKRLRAVAHRISSGRESSPGQLTPLR